MKRNLFCAVLIGILTGCVKHDDPRITQLQNQVIQLSTVASNQNNEITYLLNQESIDSTNIVTEHNNTAYLWSQQQMTETNVSTLQSISSELNSSYGFAPVSPQSKDFQFLKTPYGNLLLSTETVEPYLDGYKIRFSIGNPTSAEFLGFSLVCFTYNSTNAFGTMRSITNDFTDSLPAGSWSKVDFILAPSSMDEVRNASVMIQLDTLSLLKPAPSSQ